MADMFFGDRKFRKVDNVWVTPTTHGFFVVDDLSTIAMLDTIERLRDAGNGLAEVAAQVGNHRLGRRQTNAAIATWQEANRER